MDSLASNLSLRCFRNDLIGLARLGIKWTYARLSMPTCAARSRHRSLLRLHCHRPICAVHSVAAQLQQGERRCCSALRDATQGCSQHRRGFFFCESVTTGNDHNRVTTVRVTEVKLRSCSRRQKRLHRCQSQCVPLAPPAHSWDPEPNTGRAGSSLRLRSATVAPPKQYGRLQHSMSTQHVHLGHVRIVV